jgi:hypothetical protein
MLHGDGRSVNVLRSPVYRSKIWTQTQSLAHKTQTLAQKDPNTNISMQRDTSTNSTMPSLLLDGEPPPMFALACVRVVRWMVHKNTLMKKITSADQQQPPVVAHLNSLRACNFDDATSDEVQA